MKKAIVILSLLCVSVYASAFPAPHTFYNPTNAGLPISAASGTKWCQDLGYSSGHTTYVREANAGESYYDAVGYPASWVLKTAVSQYPYISTQVNCYL